MLLVVLLVENKLPLEGRAVAARTRFAVGSMVVQGVVVGIPLVACMAQVVEYTHYCRQYFVGMLRFVGYIRQLVVGCMRRLVVEDILVVGSLVGSNFVGDTLVVGIACFVVVGIVACFVVVAFESIRLRYMVVVALYVVVHLLPGQKE